MQDEEEPMSETEAEEEALELEAEVDDLPRGPGVMPWLIPVLMVAAFFAFVVVLVLFVL